jgi:hypothetical protein
VFKGTIEAVKAAEEAAQAELDALYVPYNPADGSGGVHWNGGGAAVLSNALRGLSGLREELEKRQAPIDAQAAAASEVAAPAPAPGEVEA